MTAHHAPLVDATIEIKLEAAIGHLWFEEIISDDRNEDISMVWEHLDRSAWYARAMLEGGENSHGVFIPLHDPALRREIEEVLVKIREFRAIAEKRWAARSESGIGSVIDQRFDAVFEDFLMQAGGVETALKSAMARDLHRFRAVQVLMIVLCLGLTTIIGFLFLRYERRQALDMSALKKSEEKLSITLDSIGDAVIATDTEGCVSRMNPVAEYLTGWTDAEARGRPLVEVFQIINARTRENVESPVTKVLREGVVVGLANHTALIARDGTERQIADSGAPIRDADGEVNGVVLVFRDVTEAYARDQELRESEEATREQRERAQTYLDIAGVMFVALDTAGTVTLANRKTGEVLGYAEEEIVGKNWFDTFLPERQREAVKEVSERIIRGEIEPLEYYENPVLTKDGAERPSLPAKISPSASGPRRRYARARSA